MRYLISIKDLLALPAFLNEYQINAGIYSISDFSLITLLELLIESLKGLKHSQNKMGKVLLGIAIYHLENLQNGFSYLSPNSNNQYRVLNQKLNISEKNPLHNDERLYYLTQSYDYIETFILDEDIKQIKKERPFLFKWQNKTEILADIREIRKSLLSQKKFAKQMLAITHATPELLAIQQRTYEFLLTCHTTQDLYGKLGWITHDNPIRVKQLNWLRTLHQTSAFYFPSSPYDEPANYVVLQESEAMMRKGLLSFLAMNIKKEEYPFWKLLSPAGGWLNEGSVLFKKSLSILNNLQNHDYNERIEWLRALGNHLGNLKKDPSLYQEIVEEWTTYGKLNFEKELEIFQNKILVYISALEIKKHQPSYPKWMITQLAEKGARYGIKKVIDWGAKKFIQAGITTFAAQVGGPLGVSIFVTGNVISYVLMQPIATDVISSTISATISCSLLNRMSKTIGEKTADLITNFFTTTKEEFAIVRENMCQEDEIVFCRLINTLLKLPDDEVSEAEKNHIKMVFPIVEGKLQPLIKSEIPMITQRTYYA